MIWGDKSPVGIFMYVCVLQWVPIYGFMLGRGSKWPQLICFTDCCCCVVVTNGTFHITTSRDQLSLCIVLSLSLTCSEGCVPGASRAHLAGHTWNGDQGGCSIAVAWVQRWPADCCVVQCGCGGNLVFVELLNPILWSASSSSVSCLKYDCKV